MSMAGSPFPWTWAIDKATIAGEAAGSGQGTGIDSLDSTAIAVKDEGTARRGHGAQVGHWEEV